MSFIEIIKLLSYHLECSSKLLLWILSLLLGSVTTFNYNPASFPSLTSIRTNFRGRTHMLISSSSTIRPNIGILNYAITNPKSICWKCGTADITSPLETWVCDLGKNYCLLYFWKIDRLGQMKIGAIPNFWQKRATEIWCPSLLVFQKSWPQMGIHFPFQNISGVLSLANLTRFY